MLQIDLYPLDLSIHTSQIYAGLYDMDGSGQAEIRIPMRKLKSISNRVNAVWLDVRDEEKNVKIIFDMRDIVRVDLEGLNNCDIYFKRSFEPSYIAKLPQNHISKVLPYGLNYACRSRSERDLFRRIFSFLLQNRSLIAGNGKRKRSVHKIMEVLGGSGRWFRCGPLRQEEFEIPPAEAVDPVIIFLTRVWQSPADPDGENVCPKLRPLNDQRAEVCRALRLEFGSQFIGGLIPNEFARRHYPDCIATVRTDKEGYLEQMKKSLVAVTSTGLDGSIGFKIPEYLAASKCIVTEPFLRKIPVPLKEGENYLSFRSADECIGSCRRLLTDRNLSRAMQGNNFEFYTKEVKPLSRMEKCLRTALQAG